MKYWFNPPRLDFYSVVVKVNDGMYEFYYKNSISKFDLVRPLEEYKLGERMDTIIFQRHGESAEKRQSSVFWDDVVPYFERTNDN